jgi:hypothetical protein
MHSHIGLLVWLWILVAPLVGIFVLSSVAGGDRR